MMINRITTFGTIAIAIGLTGLAAARERGGGGSQSEWGIERRSPRRPARDRGWMERQLTERGRVEKKRDAAVGRDGGAGVRADAGQEGPERLDDDFLFVENLIHRAREQPADTAQRQHGRPLAGR